MHMTAAEDRELTKAARWGTELRGCREVVIAMFAQTKHRIYFIGPRGSSEKLAASS